MKYSKSAIGLLTAQYRSVLKKCWLINVGLFALGAAVATPANATAYTERQVLTENTSYTADDSFNGIHSTTEIYGGAIYNINGYDLSINGSSFTGNYLSTGAASDARGGAIFQAGGNLTIDNASFIGNYTERGAGGRAGAIQSGSANTTISNSIFQNNSTRTTTGEGWVYGGMGAAIYQGDGTLTLNNNTFGGDTAADGNKGAEGIIVSNGGVMVVNGNTFKNNSATGGIFNLQNDTAEVSFIGNNIFENNTGTPLYNWIVKDTTTFANGSNTVFNSNTANTKDQYGGANNGGAIWNIAKVAFEEDSTASFTGNHADGKGGAVYNYSTGTIDFNGNATFSNNTDSTDANDIYNAGTINFGGTADLAGGIDGEAGTVNVSGDVKVANALKNQTVNVNAGELHLDAANVTGSTVNLASDAVLNTINNAIEDYSSIQLADNSNIKVDANLGLGQMDLFSAKYGHDTVDLNVVEANMIGTSDEEVLMQLVNNGVKVNTSSVIYNWDDDAKKHTKTGIVGSGNNDGKVKVSNGATVSNLEVAARDTSSAVKESVVYEMGENEDFGSATVENANFIVEGNNQSVNVSGSFGIDNQSVVTINNATFNGDGSIDTQGKLRINDSEMNVDINLTGGASLESDPTSFSGTVSVDSSSTSTYDGDTFTSTGMLSNAGTANFTNTTFENGSKINGNGGTGTLNFNGGVNKLGAKVTDNNIKLNNGSSIVLTAGSNIDGLTLTTDANNGTIDLRNSQIDTLASTTLGSDLNVLMDIDLTADKSDTLGTITGGYGLNLGAVELLALGGDHEEIQIATAGTNVALSSDVTNTLKTYYNTVSYNSATGVLTLDGKSSPLVDLIGSWGTGNYIKAYSAADAANTSVGANLTILDAQVKTNADAVAATDAKFTNDTVDAIFKSVNVNNNMVVDADGNTAMAGTLTANGLATLNGGVNVNNKMTVDTAGNTAIDGTLTANGLATLNGGINVNNKMTVAADGATAVTSLAINGSGAMDGIDTAATSGNTTKLITSDAVAQGLATKLTGAEAADYAVSGKRGAELAANIATYVTANGDKFADVQNTTNIITDLFNDKAAYIQETTGMDQAHSVAYNYNQSTQDLLHGATSMLNADEKLAAAVGSKQAQLVNDKDPAENISNVVATTIRASSSADDTTLVTEKAISTALETKLTGAEAADYAVSGKRGAELAANIATYVTANGDKFADVQNTTNIITDLFNDKAAYIQETTGMDQAHSVAYNYNQSTQDLLHGATSMLNADEKLAAAVGSKQAQLVNDKDPAENISNVVATTIRASDAASDTTLVTEKAISTALETKVNNAGNFTETTDSALIKDKTVVAAIRDTAAAVDANATKNTTQDNALTNLYSAVNGGTYNTTTGEVTGATALSSNFTAATNLTAAANELLGDITVATAGNYISAGANVAGNLSALDGQVKSNTDNITSTMALVGTTSAPKTGTGILAGKTITGTAGTDNLNMVDAIAYVAANAAGLNVSNVFKGATNTFGETEGSQVIITNGGSLTANTSLKVGTDTTNMLTVSSTGTKIGDANAIVGTAGNLNMGGNSLSNVASLTLKNGGETTTLSIDAEGTVLTGGADLDVGNGTLFAKELSVGQTDQFTVDASGNISTSGTLDVTGTATVGSLAIGTTGKGFAANGNLTAGTIVATGIDTSTANTVKLGGTGFTTAVTGDMTVSGDTALSGKLNVTGDTTLANTSVTGTLDVAGNTTLKNTSVDGTLDVTGKSTFGNASGSRIELNSGALTVKDSTQAVVATIDNDGNADFKGTLDVDGLASLDGGLNVNDVFDVNATTGVITLSDKSTPTANTATMAMTQIKDSTGDDITDVLKVDGTGLYTGYVASESGFTVAQKDTSTGFYVETFTVNADGEITGVGLTTDTTNGVDLGVAGTTTDIIGSAINIGGAATTTANLLAGTNGVNVSATGTDITGNFSVATNKFTVASDTGNTTVAGTMAIAGDTTVGTNFSVTAADGSMSAAGNKFSVDGNGAVRAANGEFIVDKDGNTKIKGALGAGGTGTEFGVGSDGSVKAAKGKFTVDKDGAAQAQSLAFNGDGATVLVNKIDQGAAAITDGVADTDARKQTMATNATVAKTIGNLKGIRYEDDGTTVKPASHGVTNVDDVASAISTLSQNVETATGGTFTDAIWTGAVDADKDVDYTYSPAATATATAGYHDIMSAVSQVASNIGAATTVAFNNVADDNTVNANIDALNRKVGNMNNIGYGYKNLSNGTTTQPDTVVEALRNIDASMGTIHGLAAKLEKAGTYQGNLAEGTTVEQHLTALDSAIGNRANFNKMHYTQGSKTVVDAIGKLDTKLNSVDHEVRTMRHHYDSALASAAALSALVPNARAHGNTQLSLGTGMYHGHGAMAVGGFHWFTDNILFNTGIAWDDNEATYRMGVTYSW